MVVTCAKVNLNRRRLIGMNREQFRALLDLFICADPWPVPKINGKVPDNSHEVIEELLNEEARKVGYSDWVDAYHNFSALM